MKKRNEAVRSALISAASALFLASCSAMRQTPPGCDPEELKEPARMDVPAKKENRKEAGKTPCASIGIELVLVPAGEFTMGGGRQFDDENPEHKVVIGKDFWVAKTETTQAQYKLITGQNPSFNKSNPELPVEQVSWNDAVKFCGILSEKEKDKLPKGYVYRLPTEAEWEYMCKAGALDMDRMDEYAWHSGNSGNDVHVTAQKKADANGLHDCIGNVWEWCVDSCEMNETGVVTDTYKAETSRDPVSRKGSLKVHRGGSWCYDKTHCTPTKRYAEEADFTSGDLGFRIVLAPILKD